MGTLLHDAGRGGRRVRDPPLRPRCAHRLHGDLGGRPFSGVHDRGRRPSLRGPDRPRVPLPRLHGAQPADRRGRRRHRGAAGDRGPSSGDADDGHGGGAARLRRRGGGHGARTRGWCVRDELHGDRRDLLPHRIHGSRQPFRHRLARLPRRTAGRPAAGDPGRRAGPGYTPLPDRGTVRGGRGRGRLRARAGGTPLLGERRGGIVPRSPRHDARRNHAALRRTHLLPRGVRSRAG